MARTADVAGSNTPRLIAATLRYGLSPLSGSAAEDVIRRACSLDKRRSTTAYLIGAGEMMLHQRKAHRLAQPCSDLLAVHSLTRMQDTGLLAGFRISWSRSGRCRAAAHRFAR